MSDCGYYKKKERFYPERPTVDGPKTKKEMYRRFPLMPNEKPNEDAIHKNKKKIKK